MILVLSSGFLSPSDRNIVHRCAISNPTNWSKKLRPRERKMFWQIHKNKKIIPKLSSDGRRTVEASPRVSALHHHLLGRFYGKICILVLYHHVLHGKIDSRLNHLSYDFYKSNYLQFWGLGDIFNNAMIFNKVGKLIKSN